MNILVNRFVIHSPETGGGYISIRILAIIPVREFFVRENREVGVIYPNIWLVYDYYLYVYIYMYSIPLWLELIHE